MNNLRIFARLISFLTMVLLCCNASVQAASFDADYSKWKQAQQAHDARLSSTAVASKHPAATRSNSPTKNANSTNKINLNQASVSELQQLQGVGEKKAQAILDYRQQIGGFKQIEQLQDVKGIGPKIFEKNKSRLSL